MEVDLALLADAATVDAAGKLNILGVFDRIAVPEFPAQYPHISLVLRFASSMGEGGVHQAEVRMLDPDGKQIFGMNGDIQVGPGPAVAGGQVKVPQVLNIDRLVFPIPGTYTFDVILDGEHKASVPLGIHKIPGGGKNPVPPNLHRIPGGGKAAEA